MNLYLFGGVPTRVQSADADKIATLLRLGLGSVFVIGGWWKLSRVLDPERAMGLVDRYMAGNGYINAFFDQYLFGAPDALLTPHSFLILLSGFELLSGILLLIGLLVRALSFIYAFLLWSFVIALPVVTAAGANVDGASFYSPAILVQIRDIALSGMFFTLMNIGSGTMSVDRLAIERGAPIADVNWDNYGLLLRLSIGVVFIVGGFFAGLDHIKSFIDIPLFLIAIGIVLVSGHGVRIAAVSAFAVIAW
ncbi:MAG: DoxX family membrane protein [Pseudomonadota bacterium]